MQLTREQRRTVKLAREPQPCLVARRVVATVAGPGSGKTTMQEHLAVKLRKKGHQRILKLFFNRSAADDGRRRLEAALQREGINGGVECLTTHAAALRYASRSMGDHLPDRCADEGDLQKAIGEKLGAAIASWHGERPEAAPAHKREQARAQETSRSKLVAFWIFKTLVNWLASKHSDTELQQTPGSFDDITYYPAKMGHKEKLPNCRHTEVGGWYRKQAYRVWQMMLDGEMPLLHDAYLKWAQIRGMDLGEFSAVLLDEAQDCTDCQLDAFVVQPSHADIFVVGDMAQALYSWRHAKPAQLASLSEPESRGRWFYTLHGRLSNVGKPRRVKCTSLKRTFRFGPEIGRVANCVLYVKEHSEQSLVGKRLWTPYRVKTDPALEGAVIEEGGGLTAGPKTVIGRTNYGLALAGWKELARDPTIKIAINGDGDSAGSNKFKTVFSELKECLRLFHGERLTTDKFREFDSWDDFKRQVDERELSQYNMHVNLVEEYGEPQEEPQLLAMIQQFDALVLQAGHSASDADILLSTVCQAKGLEWPRVQVLDDCIPIDVLNVTDADTGDGARPTVLFQPDFKRGDPSKTPRLDYKGDELNSWFVAVTRAQEELELPPKFWALVRMAEAGEPVTDEQSLAWERQIASDAKHMDEAHQLLGGLLEVWWNQDAASGDGGGGDDDDDDDDDEDEGGSSGDTTGKRKRQGPWLSGMMPQAKKKLGL